MRRHLVPAALLLPLALLACACGGSSAASGSGTDGKGSLTLDVGDQKGGSEAVLRAAGELKNLDYKIKWSAFTSGPPLLEAVNAEAVDIGGVGNTPPVFAAGAGSEPRWSQAALGRRESVGQLAARGLPERPPRAAGGSPLLLASGRRSCGGRRGKILAPRPVGRSVNNIGIRDGVREVDVVVIGAGQAGLSGAYHLRRTGFVPERDFVVLDHSPQPGRRLAVPLAVADVRQGARDARAARAWS